MVDKYITLPDCKIRYRDTAGAGPVLLLTHGVGASLETWEAQLAAADETIRIIAWCICRLKSATNCRYLPSCEHAPRVAR